MSLIHFVPECWAETMLVRLMFMNGNSHAEGMDLNHASGISEVPKAMKRHHEQHEIFVGFIDDDRKNVPLFFDEFEEKDYLQNVSYKRHPTLPLHLIVLKPAMERFLMRELSDVSLRPSRFGLPDDFDGFKKRLKSVSLHHDQGYLDMMTELLTIRSMGIDFILEKIQSLR